MRNTNNRSVQVSCEAHTLTCSSKRQEAAVPTKQLNAGCLPRRRNVQCEALRDSLNNVLTGITLGHTGRACGRGNKRRYALIRPSHLQTPASHGSLAGTGIPAANACSGSVSALLATRTIRGSPDAWNICCKTWIHSHATLYVCTAHSSRHKGVPPGEHLVSRHATCEQPS